MVLMSHRFCLAKYFITNKLTTLLEFYFKIRSGSLTDFIPQRGHLGFQNQYMMVNMERVWQTLFRENFYCYPKTSFLDIETSMVEMSCSEEFQGISFFL